jgi:multidrug efflux pump subunit AcrB
MLFLYYRPKFILCFTVFLALCGSLLATKLPISLYPMVNKPTVRVTLRATQDVLGFYQEWGIKIERSLKSIDQVKTVEGTYEQGLIRFQIHFGWNVDPETAKREVSTIISFYQAQLPDHEPDAIVDILDPSSENYLAITSNKYNNDELSQLLKETLKPQLDAIDGVAASMVSQKNIPFINVRVMPYKLLEYGITLEQVLDTLSEHQFDYKLGQLNTEQQGQLSIKFKKSFKSLRQLGQLKLNSILGSPVYLTDVATVQVETEVNHRFFQLDENPIVAVAIWPKPGANIYDISTRFQTLVHDFSQNVGDVIVLNSPKRYIEDAIISILYALVIGMFTAAFVVLLFYRRFKSILLICISMPISLAIGILFMTLMDVGINLLSLGGMSICIGLVVDNVIIILDQLERQQKKLGALNTDTMIAAIKTITPPIITSTMTSIVIFLPLAFTEPAVSTILKDISLVTITILFSSSLLSLFFVPVCFMLLTGKQSEITITTSDKPVKKRVVFRIVSIMLHFFDKHSVLRYIIIFSAFSICIYAIQLIVPQLRTEIVAQPKAEIIDVTIVFNEVGLNDSDKLAIIKPMRELIYEELSSDVKYVYSDVRENVAFLSLHLKSYEVFDNVYLRLNELFPSNKYADISFSPWVTAALNIKDYPSLEIIFLGQDEVRNRDLAELTYQFAKEQKNSVLKAENKPGNKTSDSLNVHINEQVVDLLFSSENYQHQMEQLQHFIEFSAEPRKLYDIKQAQGDIALKVEVDRSKQSVAMLQSVPIAIDGQVAFLKDLVQFETQKEWRTYYSKDGLLYYGVDVWFKETISSQETTQFKDALTAYLIEKTGLNELPMTFKDTQVETNQAIDSLKVALILSICAVFLIILLQFGAIFQALMVVSVVIFGLTGALVALYYFNSTLSINSLLGILILVGLTVNNSILLLDQFIHQIKHESKVSAIAYSLMIRMRSLLVTNLTTVAGMLPLVIGFGPGKDILKPLGISVSFGLVSATLLTLLVVPLMLLSFYNSVSKTRTLNTFPFEPSVNN